MAAELSPEEALRVVADTRRSATPPRVPAWFPVYAGVSFALAMVAVGVSDLSGGHPAVAQAFGIAGLVLLVAHLGMYVELTRRWRRGGLVPRVDTCATRARRRVTGWLLLAALAAGGAGLLLGGLGWGVGAFGVVAGVETWYRLVGWTRP